MAGIVAQLTKANWERKKRRVHYLGNDKCTYTLPPFDDHFDPLKHNNYTRRKAARKDDGENNEMQKLIRKMAEAQMAERTKIFKESEDGGCTFGICLRAIIGTIVLLPPILIFSYITLIIFSVDDQQEQFRGNFTAWFNEGNQNHYKEETMQNMLT